MEKRRYCRRCLFEFFFIFLLMFCVIIKKCLVIKVIDFFRSNNSASNYFIYRFQRVYTSLETETKVWSYDKATVPRSYVCEFDCAIITR